MVTQHLASGPVVKQSIMVERVWWTGAAYLLEDRKQRGVTGRGQG
jgi:hypothetical protein